jgi:hypothetical protein
MISLNKTEKGMSELEEHDCKVEFCIKIAIAIVNTQALL